MNLKEKVANYLAPDPFYVVKPNGNPLNSKHISQVTLTEAFSYYLRNGHLPKDPSLTFVGSGGGVKAYYILGAMKCLHEYGIEVAKYLVTSASSFLAIYEVSGKDINKTIQLALSLPELIEDVPTRKWLYPVSMFKQTGDIDKLLKFYWGEGLVKTEKLEHALKEVCGEKTPVGDLEKFFIMATDYTEGRSVALGKDFPEMPLYKAILASISIPLIFPLVEHVDGDGKKHMFADGSAGTNYFPLRPELIEDSSKTVLAIMLGHHIGESNKSNYSMVENVMRQGDIKDREIADLFVWSLTGATIDDYLVGSDNVNNQRLCLMVPKIDVPGYTINIKEAKRHELIERGYNDMGEMLKNFRQPKINWLHLLS